MRMVLVLQDNGFGESEWYVQKWNDGTLIEQYEVETCETHDYKKSHNEKE